MPFAQKQIAKQIIAEIAITDSVSGGTGTIGAGAFVDLQVFNIQKIQFLQVEQSGLDPDVHYAPGHVLYWAARHATAGPAVSVEVHGRTSAAGTFFPIPALTVALAESTMQTARVDSLGALWEVRIRVSNAGPGAVLDVSYAVAVRVH